jgi:hypothetical protein
MQTILKFLALFIIAFIFHGNASAQRKELSPAKNSGARIILKNNLIFFTDYSKECHLLELTAEVADFSQPFSMLLDGYNNENKLFFIETSIFGVGFLPDYKLDTNKDICFSFTSKQDVGLPKYIIKLPINEIIKTNNRDFDILDRKILTDNAGKFHNKPSYPMIEIFKKSNIYTKISENNKKDGALLKQDLLATARYINFLENYQFPLGKINETYVEEAYKKFLNEIYTCIKNDDFSCIASHKKIGFNLNDLTINSESILNLSINLKKLKISEYLLSNGSNPNTIDLGGRTPLGIAVASNNLEMVKLLIKYGADPNKKIIFKNIGLADGVLPIDLAKNENRNAIVDYLAPLTTKTSEFAKLESKNMLWTITGTTHNLYDDTIWLRCGNGRKSAVYFFYGNSGRHYTNEHLRWFDTLEDAANDACQ